MPKQLQEIIELSNRARLIPVVADSKKEERATSILLAAFTIVPSFAQAVLSEAGAKVGARSRIECYTEIIFPDDKNGGKLRPDGLIVVHQGKNCWSALVESKIGNSELTVEQVESYLDIAKAHSIDAVITISNQFASDPTHHPLKISKVKTRTVGLFHFSWTSIESKAYLLSQSKAVEDPEQSFILDEIQRYFTHDSSGINAYTKLHGDWKVACETIQNQATLPKTSDVAKNTASSWIQLWRYMSLKLSKDVGAAATVALSRKWKGCYNDYLADLCEMLSTDHVLKSAISVPNCADNIDVLADFQRKTISYSMTLSAPKDKARPPAAINWLTRQLKGKSERDSVIRAYWGRSGVTTAPLSIVLEDPNTLIPEGMKSLPTKLEVVRIIELNAKFKATKALIEDIALELPDYYSDIAQHLTKWVPKPPKISKPDSAEDVDSEE